jgi:hypothetical protein
MTCDRNGLAQLLGTFFATHFHHTGADFHFDRAGIEGAVTCRAGFLSHDSISVRSPKRTSAGDHFADLAAVEIFSYFLKRTARIS